jgi:hypothetical protein
VAPTNLFVGVLNNHLSKLYDFSKVSKKILQFFLMLPISNIDDTNEKYLDILMNVQN